MSLQSRAAGSAVAFIVRSGDDGHGPMESNPHILVVDDDREIRDLLSRFLERNGLRVSVARDEREMHKVMQGAAIDLVILDAMLPGKNGFTICRELRAAGSLPIIMLTAAGEETDRIVGLEMGADDYVAKPFNPRELLARIRAVLRRTSADAHAVLRFADTEIDLDRRVVKRGANEIKLTPAEYNLLVFFLQNPDRPLTRDMILNSVWGYESFPNTRTVDAHVVKLRQKLEPDANTPRHFLTVHGVGYRFLP